MAGLGALVRACRNGEPERVRQQQRRAEDCPPYQSNQCDNVLLICHKPPYAGFYIFCLDFSSGSSGVMAPRLTMYFTPSATLISSLVTLSVGTRIRKPEVGLGVVGMNT